MTLEIDLSHLLELERLRKRYINPIINEPNNIDTMVLFSFRNKISLLSNFLGGPDIISFIAESLL